MVLIPFQIENFLHETKSFLQLNLNALFRKKVLGLSLGLFALSIILLLSSPVLQDPVSSLYMTHVLSTETTYLQVELPSKLLLDNSRLLCFPDDSPATINLNFL